MTTFPMNDKVAKIARVNQALAKKIDSQGTFLTNEDVAEGWSVAAMVAFNAIHFCNIIDKEGTDYVRDVSFPSNG